MSPRVAADALGRRALVVKPRRRGFIHRPIIAVRDHIGMTERGEVITDLPAFALTNPHIWVTHDPTLLLNMMIDAHGDVLTYRFTDSRDPEVDVFMHTTKLASFGFIRDRTKYARKAQHTVWQPTRMFSAPRVAIDLIGPELTDLMRFARDVRSWCEDQNLPITSTLPGLAAALSRDARFWPAPRGRVPRATNERIRPYLPGVYQESHAPKATTFKAAVALDQRRAYHRAAQEVPIPDPTYLIARGFFNDPVSAPELWAPVGSSLYERTIAQPGLVAVVASSRPKRKGEWRPGVCEPIERRVRYLWTNELSHCQRHGVTIEGLVAAWTAEVPDEGLPRYGRWAEREIDDADEYRQAWLKPTLHSLYGLMATRPRDLLIGRSHGKGKPEVYTLGGHSYPVVETRIRSQAPATANVAALGTLQAAIRQRTLDLANEYGDRVLHVHADGLHLHDDTNLSLLTPAGWTAVPISNLQYIDDVSWLSDERDVLPGRDQRMRMELRRHLANVTTARARRRAQGGGHHRVVERSASASPVDEGGEAHPVG